MSNDHSLRRIFSSSNGGKYHTLGKFLPSFSKQQIVFASAADKPDVDEGDLDLINQLVSQTLLNRDDAKVADSNSNIQATGRAKEVLRNEVAQPLPVAESKAEANMESKMESSPESAPEVTVNPELNELSKEIQEVSKESKEQREQTLIKEKQQEINNLATEVATPVAVSDKPVIVLPITAKSKEEAKFKSTKYSVRWLLEWCKKVAKMFSGAVVYKEEVDYE